MKFCPECDMSLLSADCDSILHGVFETTDIWEYALVGGILHGSEYEDLDPYK